MYNFYKKLNADGIPTGNLYIRKNLEQLDLGIDLNDLQVLEDNDWCVHLNTPKPTYDWGNYTKKWVNKGDILIDSTVNVYDFDWQEEDETSDLTTDELNSRKVKAWADTKEMRKFVLRRTDWWELPSQAPMSAERTAFRQAWRDITTQADPFNITYPTNPDNPSDNPWEL
ncbi:phage tail assembly chaperone [bacterium]|nr:phage tail assembly chaperone [bacterium]